MTVEQLIDLLNKYPKDAIVTQDFCSDIEEIEAEHIDFIDGAKEYAENGKGVIRHHGHLMELDSRWWPASKGEKPESPEFVKHVHIRGN